MKKTFTILHTNDMHSAFIGMGPSSDYTPFTLNDDTTRGGYARLATVIANRKRARADQGPVGQPLGSRVEALDDPRVGTPDLLPPPGTADKGSVAVGTGNDAVREIKEWQAIMDHLRSLPVKNPGELPAIPVDERAMEVRGIRMG